MRTRRRVHPLSGVRGRVVLTVLVVTAILYSLLGSVGFLHIANSGRDAIRERVTDVVDQLEAGLRAGASAVSLTTPDGVEAVAVEPGGSPFAATDDIVVRHDVTIRGNHLELVGHASQARLTDSLRSLYRGLWIGVPLAVLLTAVMAGLATGRALRPVSVITDLAATIDGHGSEDATARVPVPETDDEIEHLARTVNEMLDRIAAGRSAQRQFTSDAAHELRTPLMALQGEIELAQRPAAQVDAEFLERVDALTQRIARRVDDLVLLSTLDERPPLDLRDIDVLGIVQTEAAALPAGDTSPALEIVGEAVTMPVDERLVARAVRNLLANAQRHAASTVRAEVVATDGGVLVHVDDDGPGVPEAQREFVLRRFGRLDEGRSADAGGAGLGLAIVESVARAHRGEVRIDDAPLGGARFTLWLKSG